MSNDTRIKCCKYTVNIAKVMTSKDITSIVNVIKTFGLIMYGICNKLVCLSKPMKVTQEETLVVANIKNFLQP
jgi:hypothetical protein